MFTLVAARQLHLLEITVTTRKAAGTPRIVASGLEQKFRRIQPHYPLLDDLKIVISELDESRIELTWIKKKAKKASNEGKKRDHENAESRKELHKEREDLLLKLARVKEIWGNFRKKRRKKSKFSKRKQQSRQEVGRKKKRSEWRRKRRTTRGINREKIASRYGGSGGEIAGRSG